MKRRLAAMLSAFDSKDIPILALIFGVALIGYGASQIHHGAGPIIVGTLLVIYVRPLSMWVKK